MLEQGPHLHEGYGLGPYKGEGAFHFGNFHVQRHTDNLGEHGGVRIPCGMVTPGHTLGQVVIVEFYRQIVGTAEGHGHGEGVFVIVTVDRHLETIAGAVQFQLKKQAVFLPVLHIVAHAQVPPKPKGGARVVNAVHRFRTRVQQVVAGIPEGQEPEWPEHHALSVGPFRAFEGGAPEGRQSATPEKIPPENVSRIRQAPAGFIQPLVRIAVLKTRAKVVQIAAHAELGNLVIVLIVQQGSPGIKSREASGVSENAVGPLQRHKAGFPRQVGECGSEKEQNAPKQIEEKRARRFPVKPGMTTLVKTLLHS